MNGNIDNIKIIYSQIDDVIVFVEFMNKLEIENPNIAYVNNVKNKLTKEISWHLRSLILGIYPVRFFIALPTGALIPKSKNIREVIPINHNLVISE